MPKVKTNAASKKRFALTGTGKIKRKHAYHSHILTKKSITKIIAFFICLSRISKIAFFLVFPSIPQFQL